MNKSLFAGVLALISLSAFENAALADTSLTLKFGYGAKQATARDAGGVEPKDFITDGIGEEADYLLVCYTGRPSDVREIVENIAGRKKHWELDTFELAGEQVHVILKNKHAKRIRNGLAAFIANPCR
jgi:hypothetical protein